MKRIISIIIAAVMIICIMGCEANKTEQTQKDVKIVWYVGGDEQPDISSVMSAINEKLHKELGVQLELKFVEWKNYSDKMNMLFSGGDNFDLCFTSTWSNDFMMNASGGLYLELNSYLEGDNKKLKDSIPSFVWDDAKINGNIYAVPNYQVCYYQECALTPKRLADKYNLDISSIKKLSDIEPYLAQLKKNEPDIHPFNPWGFTADTISYKSLPSISSLAVNVDEGETKLYSKYETKEYREMLHLFRDYYEKGYIRSDILADISTAAGTKYGVWCSSSKPGSNVDNLQLYGEEVVEIPLQTPYIAMGAAQAAMTAVSKNSKHPAETVKLLELVNTDKELYNMICFGIEGKHYEKIDDDMIRIFTDKGYVPNEAWVFGNQFNAYYIEGQQKGSWEETDRINRTAKRSVYRGFTVDFSKIKSNVAKLRAVENEYKYIVLGTEEPDALLKEFVGKMKEAGLDEVYEEVQMQMNDFLNNKK